MNEWRLCPGRHHRYSVASLMMMAGATRPRVQRILGSACPALVPGPIPRDVEGLIHRGEFPADPASSPRAADGNRTGGPELGKHPGKPEDVVAAIVFAATNGFVTGTVIDVTGGALLARS